MERAAIPDGNGRLFFCVIKIPLDRGESGGYFKIVVL